jgi:predicted DNA-binding transcriptional regulator AlpA
MDGDRSVSTTPTSSARLLTTEQVADLLGLPSARAVYNRRHRRSFPPAVKLGRSLRWRLSDIEEYVAAHVEAEEARG